MKDIICPKCGTAFHVDESTYADILSQVRSKEFNAELSRRIDDLERRHKVEEEAAKMRAENEFERKVSAKDKEIGSLKNEIATLKGVLSGYGAQKEAEIAAVKSEKTRELFDAVHEKEVKINELSREIAEKDHLHRIEILETKNEGKLIIEEKDRKIAELSSELKAEKLIAANRENQLKEQHRLQLSDKQGEIDRLKDFKLRLSTKMVGETLEQHCYIQFSQAQSMGLYPDAVFEKDNISVEGTKGDFIFRDFIDENEYVSVMFEMKNEVDTTAIKHKNEDFLEKLDKDRNKKNCEYAVLVSMLEQGNELYDAGIVDMSHRFPKMIVIRPQFFMPVLRLLSEGARKGFMERKNLITELEKAREESIDLTRFQDKINKVVQNLNDNYEAAHKKFVAANEGIDKVILMLEKQIKTLRDVKASFEASDLRLLKAHKIGGDELTIKRLTHGIPSVRRMIDESK